MKFTLDYKVGTSMGVKGTGSPLVKFNKIHNGNNRLEYEDLIFECRNKKPKI